MDAEQALDGGTLAYDPTTEEVLPHIHVSVGLKHQSATGYTSHLLGAKVQFVTELYLVEIAEPTMTRVVQPNLYNVPLLNF